MKRSKSSFTVGAWRAALFSALGSLPLRTSANQSWAMARAYSTVISPKRPMAGLRRWPLLAT
jgi:hypothetical protein